MLRNKELRAKKSAALRFSLFVDIALLPRFLDSLRSHLKTDTKTKGVAGGHALILRRVVRNF
jgi:hypothetical protein